MIEFTRRSILTSAVGVTAAAVAPLTASLSVSAAAPPAGKQAPGYYRYKVGNYEVTAVTDGVTQSPLADNYVKNAPKDAVNAALAIVHMEKDKVTSPVTPIVVNTGSKLIVIDTGFGPNFYEQTKGLAGQFHSNLAAAGIDRNAVDIVVISHFHVDHISGLLTADHKPAFPNAEIMVPASEWRFWMDDGNMSRAPAGSPVERNFRNSRHVFGVLDQATLYEPGKELVSGITAIATPGHTPGHTSHIISSGSGRVIVQADVTSSLGLLFVRNPGWHVMFDMDGPTAEQTRRRIYDMATAEKMLVQGYHYPFPAAGYLENDGAAYRWAPVAWNPVV
jgi:glyoxylase-like metal-dependent hydrolase (beta-lactamase superfamily II)